MDHFMWPLFEGALTADDLRPFSPLGYRLLARALDLGLMNQGTLIDGFSRPGFAVAPPSTMLDVFLRTSSSFDRRRDIQEELDRLARSDDDKCPSLWMILARLILSRYADQYEALRILQEVYQVLGAPEEMRPYTLIGDP